MFDSLISNASQELLKARLDQAGTSLRGMTFTTRQDALVAVYTALNQALALGNNVTPLVPISREGPAVVGDIQSNFSLLTKDAQAIIKQLTDVENTAASLFNQFASTYNNLEQSIRQTIYNSSRKTYIEPFLNDSNLHQYTATLDFGAGLACLPLVSETSVLPDATIFGITSVGSIDAASSIPNLFDGKPETSLLWNGGRLELVFQFNQAQIINRVQIELAGYQGLIVEEFSSSPDGVLKDDLLADLPSDSHSMDGSSSKFAGNWIADFDPRYMKQLRLIIADKVGNHTIELRNISLSSRSYSPQASLQSGPIKVPFGLVKFRADARSTAQLTLITHQLSTDGLHFSVITPEQILNVGNGPFWYQAGFARLDSNFSSQSTALLSNSQDPGLNPDYTLASSSTVDLGQGILERTLSFSSIGLPGVSFEETPIPGTLTVFNGVIVVPSSAYGFANNTLTFPTLQTGITVRYQTSAYGAAGLASRKNYYSPVLYQVSFEQV